MKIAIGCDPNAAELKQELKAFISGLGHECVDFGGDDPIYANTAVRLAKAVAAGECDRGVLICGTGIGVSIAANKVPGIRCALCTDSLQAEMTRRHNDANMMALGAGVTGPNLARRMLELFLNTEFEGGRHARRVALLDAIH